jgi:catechol 2,3-dioxygenase-like lactoylglutathione lyase family enzyme
MDNFGAERIDHVTILVTNLDKARDFYSRVLCLREVPRPPSFDFPGMWFKTGGAFLHLLGKPAADTTSPRHFCYWVRDIQQAKRHAEIQGWEVLWQSTYKIAGIDRFFVYDPDGNRIEIQGADRSGAPPFGLE